MKILFVCLSFVFVSSCSSFKRNPASEFNQYSPNNVMKNAVKGCSELYYILLNSINGKMYDFKKFRTISDPNEESSTKFDRLIRKLISENVQIEFLPKHIELGPGNFVGLKSGDLYIGHDSDYGMLEGLIKAYKVKKQDERIANWTRVSFTDEFSSISMSHKFAHTRNLYFKVVNKLMKEGKPILAFPRSLDIGTHPSSFGYEKEIDLLKINLTWDEKNIELFLRGFFIQR